MTLRWSLLLLALGQSLAVPSFQVDLDAPPRERWRESSLYYKEYLPNMISQYILILEEKLGKPVLDEWVAVLRGQAGAGPWMLEELEGIVEAVASKEVTVNRLLLWGAMYELASPTACSGFLAAMDNGTVVHGRNMDYSFHWEGPDKQVYNWPAVTFEIVFVRGGKPLFLAVGWPGHVGISTGMRFGGWSFEQNTRMTNNMQANLVAAKAGSVQFGLVSRLTLENVADFETARDTLYAANLMAPMYFVLAGAQPFEGAVLTIDRGGVHEPGTPPIQSLGREAGMWHLIQTNDDLNKAPLDERRPLMNFGLMGAHPEDVSVEFMEKTMLGVPAFTPLTVYTFVAMPATGYHRTILRPEALQKVGDPLRARHSFALRHPRSGHTLSS